MMMKRDVAYLVVDSLKDDDDEVELGEIVRSLTRANRTSLQWLHKKIEELKEKKKASEAKTVTVTVKVE